MYARNPGGGEFPRWATGEALALARASLPCGPGRGTVRRLTAREAERESAEASTCEATLETACASADRRAVAAIAAELRRCRDGIAYAAIDYPGAGWRGDSASHVHIPIGG